MTQLKALRKSESVPGPASPVKKLFIAGVGAVGGTLLKQVSKLSSEKSLRVLGVCNTRHTLWYDRSQTEYSLERLLQSPALNWKSVIRKLASYEEGTVVFIDTTGNPDVAGLYPQLFDAGIHVVTPSKLANTGKQYQYDQLHQTARKNNVRFLYETNVGAGLPIIHTIKNLIETGDEIVEINGVLSGTMTYLFSELDKGESFSNTVIRARTLGYAEPDPRDDLSGEDVARKFLILARCCGLQAERDQLEVESLIPSQLEHADSTTFMEELHRFDRDWKNRLSEEEGRGHTLRYTGSLKNGKIKVGIESVPRLSPLGQLAGTNNLVQIKTRRYYDQPLIIQGPGAGKEVTAAGVLADVLNIP